MEGACKELGACRRVASQGACRECGKRRVGDLAANVRGGVRSREMVGLGAGL